MFLPSFLKKKKKKISKKINSIHILESSFYLVQVIKLNVMVICHVQSWLEFGCYFTLLGR